MNKISFYFRLLFICFCHTSYGQQLLLEPFAGISYPLLPIKELRQTHTFTNWGGSNSQSYQTYKRDTNKALPGVEAGLRTNLQLNTSWGIRLESGVQQMHFRRKVALEQEISQGQYSYIRESDLKLLYFYQSLEASYKLNDKLATSLGGYAGTLLSSYQNDPLYAPPLNEWPTNLEDFRKAGHGLKDTQLGLQASFSYHFALGIGTTLTFRKSLQSLYTEDAQPAGPIRPTSISLTIGYRFNVK